MSQSVCLKPTLAKAFTLAARAASRENKLQAPYRCLLRPVFMRHHSVKEKKFFFNAPQNGALPVVPQGLCTRIRSRVSFFQR